MNERVVLAALVQSRKAYALVSKHHSAGDFSDIGELVYQEVVKYYTRDTQAQHVDKDSLSSRLCRTYPKHKAKFNSFITKLRPVSVDNILDDYSVMKADSLGGLIGGYLIAGQHDKAAPLLDKYNALQASGLQDLEDAPLVYTGTGVDNFAETLTKANRIPIAPKELNDAFNGGLIPGCHVLVYASPETGKTAFGINIAWSMAVTKRARAGNKVMYIGNEESAPMYLMRMLCRFTGWSEDEVQADRVGADKLAASRGWDNLIFVYLSPGTIAQVQALILEHRPDAVVIDQLSNLILGSGKEPEKTQLLEKLAYAMRMFYSRYGIAGISLAQADEKAIGKLYLTIKDVYYSNIGVQGQTDAMIGIGMNSEFEARGRRVLNITKNKLGGEHTAIIVQLYPKISAFKSV